MWPFLDVVLKGFNDWFVAQTKIPFSNTWISKFQYSFDKAPETRWMKWKIDSSRSLRTTQVANELWLWRARGVTRLRCDVTDLWRVSTCDVFRAYACRCGKWRGTCFVFIICPRILMSYGFQKCFVTKIYWESSNCLLSN